MRYFQDKDEKRFFSNVLDEMRKKGLSEDKIRNFWRDYKTFRSFKKTMTEREALEKFPEGNLFRKVFKKIY